LLPNRDSYSEFSTFIYPNPEGAASSGRQDVKRVEGGSPPVPRLINSLTLVYATYGIIFAPGCRSCGDNPLQKRHNLRRQEPAAMRIERRQVFVGNTVSPNV